MDSRIERAAVLADLGRLEDARELFAQVLAVEPENCAVLIHMAVVSLRLSEPERALEFCDAGLRVQPENVELWKHRAFTLYLLTKFAPPGSESQRNHYGDASIAAHRSVDLEPEGIGSLRVLAQVQSLTDPAAALATVDRALAIDSELSTVHEVRAEILSRLRHRDASFGDQAIAAYREALRLDPEDARPAFELACLEYERDDLAPALSHFRTAVRLDPRFGKRARQYVRQIEMELVLGRSSTAASTPKFGADEPALAAAVSASAVPVDERDPSHEQSAGSTVTAPGPGSVPAPVTVSGPASGPVTTTAPAPRRKRRWGRAALLLLPILLFIRLAVSGCSPDTSDHQPVRTTGPGPLFPITDPAIESGLRSFPPVVLVPHG